VIGGTILITTERLRYKAERDTEGETLVMEVTALLVVELP
jgi:hypothetical protein